MARLPGEMQINVGTAKYMRDSWLFMATTVTPVSALDFSRLFFRGGFKTVFCWSSTDYDYFKIELYGWILDMSSTSESTEGCLGGSCCEFEGLRCQLSTA